MPRLCKAAKACICVHVPCLLTCWLCSRLLLTIVLSSVRVKAPWIPIGWPTSASLPSSLQGKGQMMTYWLTTTDTKPINSYNVSQSIENAKSKRMTSLPADLPESCSMKQKKPVSQVMPAKPQHSVTIISPARSMSDTPVPSITPVSVTSNGHAERAPPSHSEPPPPHQGDSPRNMDQPPPAWQIESNGSHSRNPSEPKVAHIEPSPVKPQPQVDTAAISKPLPSYGDQKNLHRGQSVSTASNGCSSTCKIL